MNNLPELDAKLQEGAEKNQKNSCRNFEKSESESWNVICIFNAKTNTNNVAQKTK